MGKGKNLEVILKFKHTTSNSRWAHHPTKLCRNWLVQGTLKTCVNNNHFGKVATDN